MDKFLLRLAELLLTELLELDGVCGGAPIPGVVVPVEQCGLGVRELHGLGG